MPRKISFLPAITILVLLACACSAQPTQTAAPAFIPSPAGLPASEAYVPRVTVTDAKAALDSGAAILLDVRSPAAFEVSHIPGAISIPLAEIEANPTGLNLENDQWIIAYCA